ncbi:unnamed protein product [marine sediment metagenome]|uniref:Uncharacterized protein n=1 Tax=marine sediment metagenome TaxID=412755 RepID=X1N784_9ZZZZ
MLTIDEAISKNKALEKDIRAKGLLTFADAILLGIEALKVFSELDPMFRVPPFGLLPGETPEGS